MMGRSRQLTPRLQKLCCVAASVALGQEGTSATSSSWSALCVQVSGKTIPSLLNVGSCLCWLAQLQRGKFEPA